MHGRVIVACQNAVEGIEIALAAVGSGRLTPSGQFVGVLLHVEVQWHSLPHAVLELHWICK